MALSIAELSLVEQRVANDSPSTGVAYLLWLFLWFVSAHRFYLGKTGTAILQILSYFVLVGFVWVLIDAFLIPGMIRAKKDEIRHNVVTQLSAAAN
ncbi:TM2 domain-containing protein [Sphingomonas sp. MMS24-J13]|uniref:TM2 domain-containing protein n=1 Tax=Sphingomonas sp. MMS24-J13 TaxID=3238686 RepID=UPI00384BA78C